MLPQGRTAGRGKEKEEGGVYDSEASMRNSGTGEFQELQITTTK